MMKRSFAGNQSFATRSVAFSELMIQKIAASSRISETVKGTASGRSPTNPTSNAMPAGKSRSRKRIHCLASGARRGPMIMKALTQMLREQGNLRTGDGVIWQDATICRKEMDECLAEMRE